MSHLRTGLSFVLAFGLGACATTPPGESADAALARAAQAMGVGQLKTLRYVGEGTGHTFGQAFTPGSAWPRITLHSVTRSIDYENAAMRDEIVLSRAEPKGGGGYPISGQQRNDQFVSGELAWNQTGPAASPTATPGPRFVGDRIHQLWITPHGVVKAALRQRGTASRGLDGATTVAFEQPGWLRAAVVIDAAGLVSRVDSTVPDPVLGDTAVVTNYSDYRDAGGGVKFPMRVRQTMGGYPVLDLTVKEVQANPALAIVVPDAARNQAERVTADKVAEGVWFIGGGSHNSVAIEQSDHMVLVETPLNDARSQAVIDQVKQLVPGKPIRFVVNSHAHFDHAGGVRAAVAEGATIVTQAANAAFFERALAQSNSVRPDRLAQSGRKALLRSVADRLDLGDPTRPIELHRIADSVHGESFLMVYLPREKLLIEADAYTPAAAGTPPPSPPNPNHLNLVDNIERLKLAVERILPLHGRVVPVAELYTAAGRTPAAR